MMYVPSGLPILRPGCSRGAFFGFVCLQTDLPFLDRRIANWPALFRQLGEGLIVLGRISCVLTLSLRPSSESV